MKFKRTERFKKKYKSLPAAIQKATLKQLEMLAADNRHPSLNIKKMQGTPNIWECRITKAYRLTFEIEGDVILLRNIGPHDILKKP